MASNQYERVILKNEFHAANFAGHIHMQIRATSCRYILRLGFHRFREINHFNTQNIMER